MRRREFIAMLGGAAAAWPLAARAQQAGKVYRIGILEPIPVAQSAANHAALRKGLRELGYVEGRNLIIEFRSSDGRAERFPDLAAELVRLPVDLLVTRGTPAATAARNATNTIPVVMATIGDPLAVVASLAHPGGNVTGMGDFIIDLTGKHIELVKRLVPSLSRVAYLDNMNNSGVPAQWEETKTAARALGLEIELLDMRKEEDLGRLFEAAVQHHVDALIVGADGIVLTHRRAIIDLAARNRLPALYQFRELVEIGGLISYGANRPDLYFRAASFIDKIFKGAKPAELPIEQPTKLELVINLKTAKALGLSVPQSLLLSADEVIE
jgi:putative ABC transport system substrate-binding protein